MILRATELFTPAHGSDAATKLALALYVAYNAAAMLASLPAGRVADRRGGVLVMTVGAALFGVAYVGLAVTGPSFWPLAIWFVAAGVAIGCVETAEHSTVATLAPVAARGSAFGLLAAIQSFGNLAASGLAGVLWTVFSPTVAFGYAAAWMAIAAGALALWCEWRLGKPPANEPVGPLVEWAVRATGLVWTLLVGSHRWPPWTRKSRLARRPRTISVAIA